MISKLTSLTVPELLELHTKAVIELRRRNILRSANTPTGDLAEYLFCESFKWKQENNSKKGYDAYSGNIRYQIKGRKISATSKSRQLSAIRNIDAKQFEFLAGVLFDQHYRILRAALIPWEIVRANGKHNTHTNSFTFYLREQIWDISGVEDVTDKLISVKL